MHFRCIVSLLALSTTTVLCMNNRPGNHTYDPALPITILFHNRQRITLDFKQAKKFKFFKNALDFTGQPNKHNVIKIPNAAPRCITKENLSLLLKDQLPPLTLQTFDGLYKTADYLLASERVWYPLAKAYMTHYYYRYISPEYNDIKNVLGVKHCLNSSAHNYVK